MSREDLNVLLFVNSIQDNKFKHKVLDMTYFNNYINSDEIQSPPRKKDIGDLNKVTKKLYKDDPPGLTDPQTKTVGDLLPFWNT